MPKHKREARDKRRERPAGPYRVPAVELEVVPLPDGDAPPEACALCGRLAPLRRVLAIRGGQDAEDLLGALAVCDEHATPAAALLARAFALVFGTPPGAAGGPA